jgi:hypothetical protein
MYATIAVLQDGGKITDGQFTAHKDLVDAYFLTRQMV